MLHVFKSSLHSTVVGLALLSLLFTHFLVAATGTTVTLAVSETQVTYGNPVTLTATVAPISATGTVTFYDGVFVVGTSQLSGGGTGISTTLLGPGAHKLRALYGGDSGNTASASSPVALQVIELAATGFQDAPGSPVLTAPQYATSPERIPAAADFNGDGKLDLAIFRQPGLAGAIQILFGDGKGGFRLGDPISTGYTGRLGSPGSNGLVVGDVNGDGKPDLVFTALREDSVQSPWTINVWLGDGNGGFTPAPGSPFVEAGYNEVGPATLADFDGDGHLDLAFGNFGNLSVWLGDGTGSFPRKLGPFPLPLFPNIMPGQLDVLDFNGDGNADLLVTDSFRFQLLLGDGTGNLTPAPAPSSLIYSGGPTIGDFNNDGMSDIALPNYDFAGVNIILGNAQSNISEHTIPLPAGSYVRNLATGDFNGDGKLDLLLLGPNSNTTALQIMHGDGTGGFASPSKAAQLPEFSGDLSVLELKGDGKADVVLVGGGPNDQNVITSVVKVLFGTNISAPASITVYAGDGHRSPMSPPSTRHCKPW